MKPAIIPLVELKAGLAKLLEQVTALANETVAADSCCCSPDSYSVTLTPADCIPTTEERTAAAMERMAAALETSAAAHVQAANAANEQCAAYSRYYESLTAARRR